MKLTGKCKEEFEKWYLKNYPSHDFGNISSYPPSMQYGVLVDYFDSVWIDIYIQSYNKQKIWRAVVGHEYTKGKNTRQEARIKAIEKANEIRNNQL